MPNNSNRGGTSGSSGGSRRGFAAMDQDKQREISSKGGRASGGRNRGGRTSSSGRGGSKKGSR